MNPKSLQKILLNYLPNYYLFRHSSQYFFKSLKPASPYFLLLLIFICSCAYPGNKIIKSLDSNKKLIVGKIILEDKNGGYISSDIVACFRQSDGSKKCIITRFNEVAASVRSLNKNDMDYLFLEVLPGNIKLESLELYSFSNSPNHDTFSAAYVNGDITFNDQMIFNVDANSDVTYFGNIYLNTKKITKITDEQERDIKKLNDLNQTGKKLSVTKNIINPKKTIVNTKISYLLSCLMMLNCKCVFQDCID